MAGLFEKLFECDRIGEDVNAGAGGAIGAGGAGGAGGANNMNHVIYLEEQ